MQTAGIGQGVGGSNRVEIIFPDGAIQKQWLQVRVLANGNTGLQNDDPIAATYASADAANPAAAVGTYPGSIVPALVDPAGRLGNYTAVR